MKIAALTMVYRDHWALSRWYAHHGAQLGYDNLFVVAHGADPDVARICPKASILTIPRDRVDDFDRWRGALLDGIHAGLSNVYDWVIRSDADELLCVDPDVWRDVPQALAAQDAPVLWALGFDVVEQPGDAGLTDGPVLGQRRHIGFSGHYSKAVAASRAIPFRLHGVGVAPRRLAGFPYVMPRGLYLAHVKYANRAVLDAGNRVREQVARDAAHGGPGTGWSDAGQVTERFYDAFAEKPEFRWTKAEGRAYETLSTKPTRHETFNVVKARAMKLPFRTVLPDRFAGQG